MFPHRYSIMFIILVIVTLITGCQSPAAAPNPTMPPTQPPTQTPADTATPVPTATNTPLPTATYTPVPPTDTATPLPTATATTKPTQPPAPTKAPATAAPATVAPAAPAPTKAPTTAAAAPTKAPSTPPPSAPGVDLVAKKGQETCVNKYVSVAYPWEGESDPKGRKMLYWDAKWSNYPMFARPNIKFHTVLADCDDNTKQCKGFTADFCVYVDGSAPGGTYETDVALLIASAYPGGGSPHMLAQTVAKFSWLINY